MSDKFIPYEKMSKKKQNEYNKRQRKDFGDTKPISVVFKSKKDYNRQQEKEKIRKGNFDE